MNSSELFEVIETGEYVAEMVELDAESEVGLYRFVDATNTYWEVSSPWGDVELDDVANGPAARGAFATEKQHILKNLHDHGDGWDAS